MRRAFLFLAAGAALLLPLRSQDIALSTLNPHIHADHLAVGLHIAAPGLGELVLELPQIVPEGDGPWERPLQAQLQADASSVTVPYASGARFTYALQADRSVRCSYAAVPATARGLRFSLMIPVSFQEGGRYAFGAFDPSKPFPAAPAGRSVEAARSGPFFLADATGAGFVLDVPSDRQGLTDFRPAWNAFSYAFSYLLKDQPGSGSFVLRVAPLPSPAR